MRSFPQIILFLTICLPVVHGQPLNAPISGDAPCEAEPGADSKDTVPSEMDAEGYYSLFNGKDFTGWWQSCLTPHSSRDSGAVFRVDTLEKAIYTTDRRGLLGGVLMTRRKFENYELILDLWPDFGNGGGIFNRTTAAGVSYMTTLEYISGAGLGGAWGAFGYAPVNHVPFIFQGREDLISPGGTQGSAHWTVVTRKFQPESYGCGSRGCTSEDWPRLWDIDGWNQFKLQFYGGVDGKDSIHSKTWFRRLGSEVWVPIYMDTTLVRATPPGYIGFLVHGGGRYKGPRGTWYRNIRWKPLDRQGIPVHPVSIGRAVDRKVVEDAKIRVRPGQGFVALEAMGAARFDSPAVFDLQGRRVGILVVEGSRATWNAPGRSGVYCLKLRLGGRPIRKVFVLD